MRGDGRIYRRGAVWWLAYYRGGREIRESAHSTDARAARALLRQRLGESAAGTNAAGTITFAALEAEILRDYEVNERRSIARLRFSLARLRPFFGGLRAAQITTARIRQYVAARKASDAANATINHELAALKRMLRLAHEADQLGRVPFIPMLRVNNARQGFVEHETFRAIYAGLPAWLKPAVLFLYGSGWRPREMRALRWSDVDTDARTVVLRREHDKGGRPRMAPLRGVLLDSVRAALKMRRLDCPYVFHHDGQPIGDVRWFWKKACAVAGARGVLLYDLKRTAVRNMVRAGVYERVAMQFTGHRTRSIFDRYHIVADRELGEAQERLSAYLNSLEGGQHADSDRQKYTPHRA